MKLTPDLSAIGRLNSDGTLSVDKELTRAIKAYYPNSDFRVIIKPKDKRRSHPQNGWYWSCIVAIAMDTLRESGEGGIADADDAHEYLKLHCNSKELVNDRTGLITRIPKSTSNMTIPEFYEYCERIRQYFAENFGVDIPDPIPQLTPPE